MKEKFYYHESLNSFIGEVELQSQPVEFEIQLEESEINWLEIENFILRLNNNNFIEIETVSRDLLIDFIKHVPFGINEKHSIHEFSFKLEAVSYLGKKNNLIFSELVDSFELVFNLYHTDYAECYDPYGNYIVKIDNRLITGVRREQI